MYYIVKFMKNFSTTYEETINMNWFLFNDLLEAIRIVHAEEDIRSLQVADNHLKIDPKDSSKFIARYKELEKTLKQGVSSVDHKGDWNKLLKLAGGGN